MILWREAMLLDYQSDVKIIKFSLLNILHIGILSLPLWAVNEQGKKIFNC